VVTAGLRPNPVPSIGGERDFEQDLRREQAGMTFHPGGWLRRK
jgi:hypothetical protein